MTLAEWVRWGEARLIAGPHAERARRDAETLLLHLTGKTRAWLMAHGSDDFGGCETIGYSALIERRFNGEPIQYITGEQEFYGLPFRVTPAVLIPRPETEVLVEQVIEWAGRLDAPRIVDVGTGSGAIAVALAVKLPCAQITATDISCAALDLARENAERNGAGRIRFLYGDLLEPVANERFEIIVSNPPYVPAAVRDSLTIEVREFEPSVALFGGNDGLDVYRRLAPAAFQAIVPGGLLAVELGYGQSAAVEEILAAAGFRTARLFPDLQGIPRVAMARRA